MAFALGNSEPGDGARFPGRGLIQVTGRDNTRACSIEIFGDVRLVEHPEWLETPQGAADSAGWFWWANGLNALADAGRFDDITQRVNGAQSHAAERRAYWARARKAFGVGAA